MIFFANSQRKERKRYVSIPRTRNPQPIPIQSLLLSLNPPVSCIESVTPGKNPRRPVVLQLQPNFDHLAQMKTLQIQFLDSDGTPPVCLDEFNH